MEQIANNSDVLMVVSILIMLLFSIIVFMFSLKILFFINLRLKKIKLQKMRKKKDYSNYNLRLNSKGMPMMLVNISDPTDIILL